MVVFRWVMGIAFLLLGGISLTSLIIFIVTDISLWLKRARIFRRHASAAALLWFNVEVWGRVVWILVHW